ncbi:hypothetical protein BDQ17DRAFT_1420758 [Cyathus striatus]|nr:hypothetical protein BDQ17DRAFT_1420758 [Cyathus striatus]
MSDRVKLWLKPLKGVTLDSGSNEGMEEKNEVTADAALVRNRDIEKTAGETGFPVTGSGAELRRFLVRASAISQQNWGGGTISQYVALGATHDSAEQCDAPKCHPDTRKQLLSDINQWIKEPDKQTDIMYLHGPAGAGKSSIARSVCKEAADAGFLCASFFFWRGSQDRNNVKKFFTTIAYQLMMANDMLAAYISSEMQLDPQIINDASIERQFKQLILEPCLCLVESGRQLRNGVIVIDGLDECADKAMQVSILDLLANAFQHEGFPLAFFITSRPELHLQEVWDTKMMASVTHPISLSNVPGISQDIRTVIQSGFSCILMIVDSNGLLNLSAGHGHPHLA